MAVNVDLNKLSGIEGFKPLDRSSDKVKSGGVSGLDGLTTPAPSFKDTLQDAFGNGVNGLDQLKKPSLGQPNAVAPTSGPNAVKFSNHAVDRMMSRGISFNQADLQKLGDAVNRAQQKGAKDTLVLMNDSALIVSVKNKTVVTVMDQAALKENVFTNIDSTVII